MHLPYTTLLNADRSPKPAKELWSLLSKAGVLPLVTVCGEPLRDGVDDGVVPAYVKAWAGTRA